jgi:hypothetical protein
VRVNLGGEPERDDFGLPPVDIEIPDDARDLDRDVQAYRREQRALRRRQRRMRLGAPLTRDGVVLPLLASCLVLALIAGTLLTVFTAGPGGESSLPGTSGTTARPSASAGAGNGPKASARGSQSPGADNSAGGAAPGGTATAGPADSPTAVPTGQRLPHRFIEAGGRRLALTSLLSHHSAVVLALIPATCQCQTTLGRLVAQVRQAGLRIYLVGRAGRLAAVHLLASHLPAQAIIVTEDAHDVLYKAYPPTGLTALLVEPDGTVHKAPALSGAFRLTRQLDRLNADEARAEAPPSTSASSPAVTPPSSAPPPATSSPAASSSP